MANQYICAYELEFGVPHRITENSFVGPIQPFVQTGEETVTVGTTFAQAFPGVSQGPQDVTETVSVFERNPVRAEERAEEMDRFFASNNYSFRRITNHQITFDIDKNQDGGGEDSSNSLKITVYNLSDQTIGYLEQVSGKKPYVRLRAGYVDNLKTIFKGNVEKVEDDKVSESRKTVIHVSDGGPAVKEALSFRSYPKGTNVDDIFTDLMSDLGLPRGSVSELGSPLVTNKPLYFTGNTARALTRLAKSLGLHFSVQDMTINLVSPVQSEYYLAAVVSPDTGLIGAVSFLDENSTKTTSQNTKEEEVTVPEQDVNEEVFLDNLRSNEFFIRYSDVLFGSLEKGLAVARDYFQGLYSSIPHPLTLVLAEVLNDTREEQQQGGNGSESSQASGDSAEPRRGIKFRSLLNGSIKPNRLVAVEVPDRQGNRRRSFYKAIKVKHTGNYEGNTWYTDVEAEWVDPSNVKVRQ